MRIILSFISCQSALHHRGWERVHYPRKFCHLEVQNTFLHCRFRFHRILDRRLGCGVSVIHERRWWLASLPTLSAKRRYRFPTSLPTPSVTFLILIRILCFLSPTLVVIQSYEAEADNEYVIRGNSAIMKCEIPSFVTDFVAVDLWSDTDGNEYYPGDDSSFG